jgi:hypothetical protein
MSIDKQLITIAENQQKVYNAGYEKGKAEGGGGSSGIDYNTFWDTFQNKGGTLVYLYAFAYDKFNDETYNPKYAIRCSNANTAADNMFYNNTLITDTKVPIAVNGSSGLRLQNAFACYGTGKVSALETIRELVVTENTTYASTFLNCKVLKNITITGTIGNDFNIIYSPLTKASIMSIFNALSTTATGKTCSLKKTAVNAAFTTAEWKALTDTKPNWTFTLQ